MRWLLVRSGLRGVKGFRIRGRGRRAEYWSGWRLWELRGAINW